MGLVQVVVDQREPEWVRALRFGGVPTEAALLEAGDVVGMLEDGEVLAVERKTASDFLNTLRDDRLFAQVARLREMTPWAYLAVTGTLTPAPNGKTFCNGRQTEWGWRAVTGALLDVQDLGVRVVYVAGDFEFEAEVVRLASRNRGSIRIGGPRQAVILSDAEQILVALPGVGLDRAGKLIEFCGTAAAAIQFLTDPAAPGNVPGVGPETRKRVRRALGLAPHTSLCVLTEEMENVA